MYNGKSKISYTRILLIDIKRKVLIVRNVMLPPYGEYMASPNTNLDITQYKPSILSHSLTTKFKSRFVLHVLNSHCEISFNKISSLHEQK